MKIYEMIVEGHIRYPHGMTPEAHDLIANVCIVNPSQRLGNIQGGAERVKNHPFFRTIDWEALYYRHMKGPIIPQLTSAADASNFDDYDPPSERQSTYTDQMAEKWEHVFKDF